MAFYYALKGGGHSGTLICQIEKGNGDEYLATIALNSIFDCGVMINCLYHKNVYKNSSPSFVQAIT